MILPTTKTGQGSGTARQRRARAHSLTELLVTIVLAIIVMAAVISSHVFGMRLYELTKAKLGASDEARVAISKMMAEVRSAKILRIGRGNLNSFTEVSPNTAQIGSAIQIYPSTDTNSFIQYFWDESDFKLKRTVDGATLVAVVASAITNRQVFTCEDYAGNILMNNQNNRVLGMTLQFYQLQYPAVLIGPGNYYDFYQLRTKMTRRALE